jgi:uncharacterized protein
MEQKRCPTDGASLIEINRSGVMIDVCPECKGVWLDRGELEKVVQVTRELEVEFGGARAPTPREYSEPRREENSEPRRERDSGGLLDQARRVLGDDDRHDDDRKYRDPRRSKDSDEWEDEDRRKRKKSGLGRLLDIFD